jgi:hypothetical protein
MLRFKDLLTNAWNDWYPAATAGDNSIPQCPIDVLDRGTHIQRAWMDDYPRLTFCDCADPSDAAEWVTPTFWTTLHNVGAQHRISLAGSRLFHCYDDALYYCDIIITGDACQLGAQTIFRADVYSGSASLVALASTSDSVCYMAQLHIDGDFKYVSLHRVTATGVADCPHTIIVDEDYDQYSLTWFDAETLGDKDIIVLNERAHGHPVVVIYDSGAWGQPHPLMPMDLVDQYSYLRIAGLSAIADSAAEDVIWATGRLGFKGSTGAHAQEFDAVLRTKDGEHWSLDRYCYIGWANMRSRFLVHDGYVYYAAGDTVKRARQTWFMGNDPGALKHTLGSDVLDWTFSQPAPGSPAQGATRIAAHADQYGVDDFDHTDKRWETGQGDLAIHPGAWLWRYAGYSDENVLISTEIIDRVTSSYRAGDRQMTVNSRDAAMRLMEDWASSQDWQWLSQQKHHDDCDLVDYLYSVTAAQIRVPDEDDDETTTEVDEDDLDTTDNNSGLEFKSFNRPGVFLCTKPFDARNFRVAARFQFHHESTSAEASGLGHNLRATLPWMIGTMSYQDDGSPYFTDTNIAEDDPRWPVGFFKFAPAEGQAEAGYVITVTNTDNTKSWAYLGFVKANSTYQSVYAWKTKIGDPGWNGTPIAGKYPFSYVIGRCDDRTRIGEGFGVVGCAVDKYNLIAAFMGIAEKRLYILLRTGNKDDGAPWFILAESGTLGTLSKNTLYEVELERNGHALTARAVEFSPTGVRTELRSLAFTWNRRIPMVKLGTDEEWDDRGKVGVICNINVPETELHSVAKDQNFVMRNPAMFTRNYIVYTGDSGNAQENDSAWHSWDDDYNDFEDGVNAPPLWFGGEKYLLSEKTVGEEAIYSSLKKTRSNRSSKDCRVYHRDWDALQMCGYQVVPQNTAVPDVGWSTATPFFWLGVNENGIGLQATGNPCARASGGGTCAVLKDFDLHQTVSYARWPNWSKVEVDDYFKLVPGFYLPGRGDSEEATSHGTGTIMRQHYEPYIRIREVQAYDDDFDKTLEWVLEDMASKAGMLDFDTGKSIDLTTTPSLQSSANINWLASVYQKDFDITVDLGTKPGTNQLIRLIVRSPAQTSIDIGAADVSSLSCILLSYGKIGADVWTQLAQTNLQGNFKVIDTKTYDATALGTKVRFIGKDNFFTIIVDGRYLRTMHAGPIYGNDDDGWNTTHGEAGYIGLVQQGATWSDLPVTQPELWAWTDGIILAQRMSVTSGMQRAIRDRHIKFFGKADGTLRISTFDTRDEPLKSVDSNQGYLSYLTSPHRLRDEEQVFTDWEAQEGWAQFKIVVTNSDSTESWAYLGTALPDLYDSIHAFQETSLTTAGWNGTDPSGKTPVSYLIDQVSTGDLTFQDSTGPTDRIPTHIRVSGEEESEYIAHTAAALYGLVYALAQCPSLDEEEAYAEAQRIVTEALSYSGARQPSAGAALNWETEDLVAFQYIPADGGATIDREFIVDNIGFGYQPGQLDMRATLRDYTKAREQV